MGTRKDGQATRTKVIEAACRVFAAKGFRDATVAEICDEAGTNIASVNYYFRDKESLYVEVWEQCAKLAESLHPIDGGLSPEASPEERLSGHIRALLRRMTDTGRLGHLHSLVMKELINPNLFMSDVVTRIRQPFREHVLAVLRELLGPKATRQDLDFCELSILGQCRMSRFGKGPQIPDMTEPLSDKDVDALARHITRFSLAGIKALREDVDRRGDGA